MEETRSISAELALQSGKKEDKENHFAIYKGPGHSTEVIMKELEKNVTK